MTTPLVSVITCFHNEERFLDEAIKSVLQQTHNHWELFLVDDGSLDGSTAIAKQYAAKYPEKIFYAEHAGHMNKGLSASRNAGIKLSRGDFIAYLDADDVWLPEKLYHQLAILKNNPEATVIMEASRYWFSWHGKEKSDITVPIGVEQDKIYEPSVLMLELYPLGQGAAPCPSGILVRKSVHEKLPFEESFKGIYQMYEDQAFLSKVYLNEKVFVSSACNNLYRQRSDSLVASVHRSGKYQAVRRYYLEWLNEYLKQNKITNSKVDSLLKRALMPYHHPFTFNVLHKIPSNLKARTEKIFRRLSKR